jgi:hypothetical protein
LEQLPPFDLQQLTPAHPRAAEAWLQHLQLPLGPANSCYTNPHQLHLQQHNHTPPQQAQKQQQQQNLTSPDEAFLLQDPALWRAYQVLSFLSHVSSS